MTDVDTLLADLRKLAPDASLFTGRHPERGKIVSVACSYAGRDLALILPVIAGAGDAETRALRTVLGLLREISAAMQTRPS